MDDRSQLQPDLFNLQFDFAVYCSYVSLLPNAGKLTSAMTDDYNVTVS